ncbi:MAG: serine/threonine protein kinase [Holophagales bacterium]|nr:serine/threonine protein kinase [Holophagales bacterium]
MDDRTRTMDEGSRGVSRDEPGGIRLFAAGAAVGSRFEIRSVRGTGGSAVVYSAFDRDLKQIVALKVLRADRTSPAALARLRREVAIARQAASPRLVRVYDIDASGESVFLTMEDVEGGSLRDRLAAGALPLEETLRIAGEILEGLAVLHGLGIVHRDVKPGNVLLAADGSVKLADFGLARHFEADETRATATDAIVGTVEYLSPEQALGGDLDGRTDLYSFGITLWEMLTGGVPFRRDSAVGTALAHVREPAPPLRSVRPEAPAWLAAYVARLLSKSRGRGTRRRKPLSPTCVRGARRPMPPGAVAGGPSRPCWSWPARLSPPASLSGRDF